MGQLSSIFTTRKRSPSPELLAKLDFAKKISNGDWALHDLVLAPMQLVTMAMKSWRYRGIRIFATLIDGEPYWHLSVTAACGKNEANKLRAEISCTEPDFS